jgi:hypothetical protein
VVTAYSPGCSRGFARVCGIGRGGWGGMEVTVGAACSLDSRGASEFAGLSVPARRDVALFAEGAGGVALAEGVRLASVPFVGGTTVGPELVPSDEATPPA